MQGRRVNPWPHVRLTLNLLRVDFRIVQPEQPEPEPEPRPVGFTETHVGDQGQETR